VIDEAVMNGGDTFIGDHDLCRSATPSASGNVSGGRSRGRELEEIPGLRWNQVTFEQTSDPTAAKHLIES
jgi:hypothetical protein